MRNQLVIIGIIAVLVCVGLSGCNQITNTINPEQNRLVGSWMNDLYWNDYAGNGLQFIGDGSIKSITFNMNDGTKTITDIPYYKWELNGNEIKITNSLMSSESYGTVEFISDNYIEIKSGDALVSGHFSRLENNRLGGLTFDEVKIAGCWQSSNGNGGWIFLRNKSTYSILSYDGQHNKRYLGQWSAVGSEIFITDIKNNSDIHLCYNFLSSSNIEIRYCDDNETTEEYYHTGSWDETSWWYLWD
jgi:hypothetical protein